MRVLPENERLRLSSVDGDIKTIKAEIEAFKSAVDIIHEDAASKDDLQLVTDKQNQQDSKIANMAEKYEQAGSYPVKLDRSNLKRLGVTLCHKKLIEDSREGLVRHSSHRVARAILYWYKKVLRDGCGCFSIEDEEKQECNV